jgi:hypothetical protein
MENLSCEELKRFTSRHAILYHALDGRNLDGRNVERCSSGKYLSPTCSLADGL